MPNCCNSDGPPCSCFCDTPVGRVTAGALALVVPGVFVGGVSGAVCLGAEWGSVAGASCCGLEGLILLTYFSKKRYCDSQLNTDRSPNSTTVVDAQHVNHSATNMNSIVSQEPQRLFSATTAAEPIHNPDDDNIPKSSTSKFEMH